MQHPHRIRPAFPLGMLCFSAVLWLAGCDVKPLTVNAPPPRIDQWLTTAPQADGPQHMLDWPGTYQAILPCNDCPGVAISVQLRSNQTATVRERKLGNAPEQEVVTTYQGPFRFDAPGGSLITLGQPQASTAYRFFVSEGWLEMRARDSGAPVPQNTLFRLRKTSAPS